jgi:hypothetical protein
MTVSLKKSLARKSPSRRAKIKAEAKRMIKREIPDVPTAYVGQLARHLQYQKTDYGDALSSKQIAGAERVIRRMIREYLAGEWEKKHDRA